MQQTSITTNAIAATTAQEDNGADDFAASGVWENWMNFGGVSCSEAFDKGYDSSACGSSPYTHPALNSAFLSGQREYSEDNN